MGNKIKELLKKFNKLSPAAKASMALVFAQFFQKGLGFIITPIFTRIMPKSEYGITSTFASWQAVLLIITTLNLSSGVFNNGMIDYKDDRDTFISSILALANIFTFGWIIIYFIFHRWIDPILDLSTEFMVVMALYFFFVPAYDYWMGKQRFEYKYKPLIIVMIVGSLSSAIITIIAVIIAPEGSKATAKVLSSEYVHVSFGLAFSLYIFIKAKFRIKISYWKYALLFNLPLIPHYLSMYVLSSSDRIMITRLAGSEYTAIYNIAYTVASVMLIFWNSIDAAYTPWIYEKMDRGDIKPIRSRGNQLLIIFAFITILCSLLAPDLIRILGPSDYREGAYIVPVVAVGVFFTACYTLFMRIELFLKKTKIVMLATVFSAALNLLLNYFGIIKFGYIAAAYNTLICYACLALLHYLYLNYLGYGKIYNFKLILLICIGLCLVSFGVMATYRFSTLRYGVILIMIIVGIINRDRIISIVRRGTTL